MKLSYLLLASIILANFCFCQQKSSTKTFPDITLLNKIQFYDTSLNQSKFACGFLLKYNDDSFAITAKHIIKVIKPATMTTLSFGTVIKEWSLFPLEKQNEQVVTGTLINEDKTQLLEDKSTYNDDWLIFSIKTNQTNVKALEVRTTALIPGEKLYVIGWTRKMESGPQRVYEFEYHKTIKNRILLKDILVPEQFGGLSGAPLVDEQGKVVGIVSNGTVDPETGKKYFSPCTLDGLISFIDKMKRH